MASHLTIVTQLAADFLKQFMHSYMEELKVYSRDRSERSNLTLLVDICSLSKNFALSPVSRNNVFEVIQVVKALNG